MSLQEAQAKIPSTEFVLWREYLKLEYNRPRREDFYLAQIAAEIRRAHFTKPEKVRLLDFIIKFKKPKKVDKRTFMQRLKASKMFWFKTADFRKDI